MSSLKSHSLPVMVRHVDTILVTILGVVSLILPTIIPFDFLLVGVPINFSTNSGQDTTRMSAPLLDSPVSL